MLTARPQRQGSRFRFGSPQPLPWPCFPAPAMLPHPARRFPPRAPKDLELLASCRTVELHVQGPGDSSPSYVQSLRGEPAPAPPPLGVQAGGGDGPASPPPAGSGQAAAGTAAFTIVVPCQVRGGGPWGRWGDGPGMGTIPHRNGSYPYA